MTLLEAISPTARGLLNLPLPLKALSIRQPWAWLIVNGFKDVENRTWHTSVRGTFLIHSSATMTVGDYAACCLFLSSLEYTADEKQRLDETWPGFEHFERGGIVGSAELVSCVFRSESQWFTGDVGFVLANPKPLPFIPYKGMQKFFNVQLKEAK